MQQYLAVAKEMIVGRRDRERIERIERGEEKPISEIKKALGNPISRKLAAFASRKGVVEELSKGTTGEQVNRLNELSGSGSLPDRKLKEAIMRKAPGEMDKGIKKYQKQNKEINVKSLLTEVRAEPGFLKMCERVGLSYAWFEELAGSRMKEHGLNL